MRMGIGIGIGRGQNGGFSPVQLFASGEDGAWFDFSDTNTLYQDSTGITPVTADAQLVGMALDKRFNLALGPELVANGTFDAGTTGWGNVGGTVGYEAVWDATNQRATIRRDGGGNGRLTQTLATETSSFLLTYSRDPAQNVIVLSNDVSSGLALTASGRHILAFTGATNQIGLRLSATNAGTWIDNISCKKLAGAHARQATAGSRATYAAGALDFTGGKSLTATMANLGTDATLAYADENGVTILAAQTISGVVTLPQSTALRGAIYLDRALTDSERANLIRYWGDTYADIYVNATAGSDAYDGQSRGRALATIGAAETDALAFGNSVMIGLERGEVWREMLDLETLTGVGVVGVGDTSDPLPTLNGADIASPGGFSLAATYTNTYQITWTHDIADFISKRKIGVWENGTRLKWVSTVALCEAEAGTFHISSSSIPNPVTVYVHPTGDTNPASDGKTYEITAREYGLRVGDSYNVRNVHTTKQANHDGSFVGGFNGYGYGILSTEGVVHNQWVGVGSTHEYCVAYNCEPSTWRNLGATLFITYDTDGGAGATYRHCYAYTDSAVTEVHATFYAHTPGGGPVLDLVTYENCYAYSGYATFNAADTSAMAVQDCFMEYPAGRSNTSGGVGTTNGTTTVDNLTAINCSRLFPYATDLTVRDLRAYIGEAVSGGLFFVTDADVQDSTFIYDSALGEGSTGLFNSTSDAAIFANNVVQNSGFRALRTDDTIASDYNVIRSPAVSTKLYYYVGATNYTWADWIVQTGGDANSTLQASNATSIVTDAAGNDFSFTSTIVDEGGRAAGSRRHIDRPDWTALTTAWDAGFLGIDGTGV